MTYPRKTFRLEYFAQDYMEIAIDNYMDAKIILDNITTFQSSDYESLHKKSSIVITFCAMAIESFFNDFAAACIQDNLYYGSYDSLSIQNKFQLIVQFILKKEFKKDQEPYGLLGKLTKNRNGLVHNKSRDANSIPLDDKNLEHPKEPYKNLNEVETWYNNYIQNDFNKVKDAIRAVVQVINYFETCDFQTSACERLIAKHVPCIFENKPTNPELQALIDLGLNTKLIKKKSNKLPF